MLYKKQIDKITWEDVHNFCKQQIAENAYLDYKESFPKNLEKSISAFANTLGGMILIGISEDNYNKPKLPLKGIPFEKGLSERVTNIILGNITPPIFPEIQVCLNKDGKRAVIVIRVPQSNETPHAISGNTQVYLRTGNVNHPESLASLDEIFWLDSKRNKSVELKNKLINDSTSRFDSYYTLSKDAIKQDKGFFTLFLCPFYPHEIFLSPPELNEKTSKFFVTDYYRTSEKFPISTHYQGEIFHSGSIVKTMFDKYIFYSEFNIFGLCFFKEVLIWKYKKNDSEEITIMRESEILSRLDEFIDSSILFYNELGYYGLLQFDMILDGIKNYPLERYPGDRIITTIENRIEHSESFLMSSLSENKDEIMLNKMKKIAWTYGFDYNKQMIDYFNTNLKNR